MTHDALLELCRLAGWSLPISPPEPVTGGLQHLVCRVVVEQGTFAVKELNQQVVTSADFREKYRRSEQIAASVRDAGLTAVCALKLKGDVIHDVADSTVLVYPWVEGRADSNAGPLAEKAGMIGVLAGRIHGLGLIGDEKKIEVEECGEAKWALLASEIKGSDWAKEFSENLPRFVAWSKRAVKAYSLLDDIVIGHRDLHRRNVLWSNASTPWVVDWESAGPISAAKEAVRIALDWGHQGEDIDAFLAALKGYRNHRHLSQSDLDLGLEAYFSWVDWLEFNLQRASGLISKELGEIQFGIQQAFATMHALMEFETRVEMLKQTVRAIS